MADTRSPKRVNLDLDSPSGGANSTTISSPVLTPGSEPATPSTRPTSSLRPTPSRDVPSEISGSDTDNSDADESHDDGSVILPSVESHYQFGSDSEDMSDTGDVGNWPSRSNTPETSPTSDLGHVSYRDQLLERLTSLVSSGQLSIYPGGQVVLDQDMLPVVLVPPPVIPPSELRDMENVLEASFPLTPSWLKFLQEVKGELLQVKAKNATWTHADTWALAKLANEETMADVNSLASFSEYLTENPSSVRKLRLLGQLPQKICRLMGIPASHTYDESAWQKDLADKLFERDLDCYSKIDMICRQIQLSRRVSPHAYARGRRGPCNVGETLRLLGEHPVIRQQSKFMEKPEFVHLSQKVQEIEGGD